MSSIILGGGLSSRLGVDKLSLNIAGESLFNRTVNELSQLDTHIILVLAKNQDKSNIVTPQNVKIVRDDHSGKGPLVGIYSGLQSSHDEHNIAVACDMPFLNIELLKYMLMIAPKFDAVIPRVKDEVEPLHAVYSKYCIGIIEEMIARKDLKIRNLLDHVKVRYIEREEIDNYDPEHLSWFNINTPADLKRAEEIIEREKSI